MRNILRIFAHNALGLDTVHLNIVEIALTLRNVVGNVDVLRSDFLSLDDVHVLQFLDELIELLDVLLISVLHHVLDLC